MAMGARGQSLIEILVALAVLSGGLLGVAGQPRPERARTP